MNKYYSLTVEKEGNDADLYIFGDIASYDRDEKATSAYGLVEELSGLDAKNINVHINSYGGEVAEALAIYNTLKRSNAVVTTYVDGFACSAATIVFMAGARRVMSKVGNFLVHPAWAFTMGNADDLRKEADNLDAITEQSVTAYMEHVTKSREELLELMSEERFLTPDEVLAWGFATEIEGADESGNPTQSVRALVQEKLAGTTAYKIEVCAGPPDEEYIDKIAVAVFEKIKSEIPGPSGPEPPRPPRPPEPETDTEAPKQWCFFDAFRKD